jgi:CRISPR system Cascade subunit CasA
MSEPLHDLLHEPSFRVATRAHGVEHLTLPGLLAGLGRRDDITSFPALQAHQQHAWHAFLCQTAAVALHRAAGSDVALDESAWAERLLALTGGRCEPWALVVPDLGSPAFLQPPVPEGTLAGFRHRIAAPDDLDILITTKNHDLKSGRIVRPAPEHWVFALVSLQTMQGFSGRDNYGIARMKSGFGSRPGVAFAGDLTPPSRFNRDVRVLLESRESVLRGEFGYPEQGGIALLWTEPWDGKSALPIQQCDPFFIEICRRVRLEVDAGAVIARATPSKTRRIYVPADTGYTGDPWTPVARKDATALTISESGFPYRRVHEILFQGEYASGAAGEIRPDDPDRVFFTATALARGQGKTGGLHQRLVPLPAHVRHRFGRPEERDRLGARAKDYVNLVATADRKALHPSLCALLQGGPEKLDLTDDRTRRWRKTFEAEVDDHFFHKLWEDADLPDTEAKIRWADSLRTWALQQVGDAIAGAPIPDARRYRAVAAAERIFHGAWKNLKQDLIPQEEDSA